ncbi:hypothetical protein HDV00_011232 [Rhizophlyctis rosea]|nr:hypothetical protein HDV00_011232 [Rhizophlyctis rosea]
MPPNILLDEILMWVKVHINPYSPKCHKCTTNTHQSSEGKNRVEGTFKPLPDGSLPVAVSAEECHSYPLHVYFTAWWAFNFSLDLRHGIEDYWLEPRDLWEKQKKTEAETGVKKPIRHVAGTKYIQFHGTVTEAEKRREGRDVYYEAKYALEEIVVSESQLLEGVTSSYIYPHPINQSMANVEAAIKIFRELQSSFPPRQSESLEWQEKLQHQTFAMPDGKRYKRMDHLPIVDRVCSMLDGAPHAVLGIKNPANPPFIEKRANHSPEELLRMICAWDFPMELYLHLPPVPKVVDVGVVRRGVSVFEGLPRTVLGRIVGFMGARPGRMFGASRALYIAGHDPVVKAMWIARIIHCLQVKEGWEGTGMPLFTQRIVVNVLNDDLSSAAVVKNLHELITSTSTGHTALDAFILATATLAAERNFSLTFLTIAKLLTGNKFHRAERVLAQALSRVICLWPLTPYLKGKGLPWGLAFQSALGSPRSEDAKRAFARLMDDADFDLSSPYIGGTLLYYMVETGRKEEVEELVRRGCCPFGMEGRRLLAPPLVNKIPELENSLFWDSPQKILCNWAACYSTGLSDTIGQYTRLDRERLCEVFPRDSGIIPREWWDVVKTTWNAALWAAGEDTSMFHKIMEQSSSG